MNELACGVLTFIGFLLLLEHSALRQVMGIIVLSNAVNLLILLCGRTNKTLPAFVSTSPFDDLSNPLPQALILTAVVISFGLLAFLCMLLKTMAVKNMDVLETEGRDK